VSKPAVTSAIVGATSGRQLNENLEAVNVQLSAEELSKLDQSTSPPLLYPGWMYARPVDPAIEKALQSG
jgi:diketogulonate reductase-like aldo/keto reductase